MWFRYEFEKRAVSNCVQISEKVRRRPWRWLNKRSEKKAWALHGKSKLTETERDDTCEEQIQEHAQHFIWHQGDCSQRIRPNRLNSQFRTLLWRFTATAWKCAQTSSRNFTTKDWLLHPDTALSYTSFSPGIFWQKNNMTVVSHPPYICLFFFFQLKIKLKSRNFDTIEVIETESQAMLNTLIEHDFEDAFKIWERCTRL
jgi:hypothetical protein